LLFITVKIHIILITQNNSVRIMITLATVCDKIAVSPGSIGNIPLNIPITVLQQSNTSELQRKLALRANYTDEQVMNTWIWSIQCVFVSTPHCVGNKYFIEWNDTVHVFNLDSNMIRELVFNAIFYNDYHK